MYNAYSSSPTTYMVSSLHLYYFFSLQYILIKIEWWGGFSCLLEEEVWEMGLLIVDNRTFRFVLLGIEVRNEYFKGQGKVIKRPFNNYLYYMHL